MNMPMPETELKLSEEGVRYAQKVLDEMQKESDRSTAILLGAELDDTLGQILVKHLLPPRAKKYPGAFARIFSARIELAYRLGLLHPLLHHELHIIKDIRNEFAHKTIGITFESSEVVVHTSKLVMAKAYDQLIIAMSKARPELVSLRNQNSRERFVISGAFLLHRLSAVREQVKQVTISTGWLR